MNCHYCIDNAEISETADGWWAEDTGYDCPARWLSNPDTGEFDTNLGHSP